MESRQEWLDQTARGILSVETRSLMTELVFNATLAIARTKVMLGLADLCNEIDPHLMLGMVPSPEDAKRINAALPKLRIVVSLITDNELSGNLGLFRSAIQSPKGWKVLNDAIHHIIINVQDYTPDIPIDRFISALREVRAEILAGNDVYVHCKAGVGRSATFVAGYLAAFGSADGVIEPYDQVDDNPEKIRAYVEKIRDYLVSKRPGVNLKEINLNKIVELITELKRTNGAGLKDPIKPITTTTTSSYPEAESSLGDKLNDFVTSANGVAAISEMSMIKELRTYAVGVQSLVKPFSNRTDLIKAFFKVIKNSKDAKWCIAALRGTNPELCALLDARPKLGLFGTGKPHERQLTVDMFVAELRALLKEHLGCKTEEEFQSILDNYESVNQKRLDGGGEYQIIESYEPIDNQSKQSIEDYQFIEDYSPDQKNANTRLGF